MAVSGHISQNVKRPRYLDLCVRPFSKPILREFWTRHPQAERPLVRWWKTASNASWSGLADVRRDYPSVDLVKGRKGDLLVFNIGGNDYRLICRIEFGEAPLFVLFVGTHAEYDRLNLKEL